jgi:serine/threonine-protein kinase
MTPARNSNAQGSPTLGALRRIHALANEFEAAWKQGEPPRLEDCLAGISIEDQPALFVELLAVEREMRTRRGDLVALEEYRGRFPAYQSLAEEVFGAAPRDLSVADTDAAAGTDASEADGASGANELGLPLGTLAALPRPLPPLPCEFGNYHLLEELDEGGMGVVYKARQLQPIRRTVALKMIRPQLADAQHIERFRQEAEAAARLDHPHIVPIYEVGQHAGRPYYAMGYVPGKSLAHRLSSGPLPARQAAELVRAIARAIAYAHAQGVIHRDLKPHNVLMDAAGQPRVTDFGLAKWIGDAPTLANPAPCEKRNGATVSGQILGTPGYMPPEQARGDANKVGPPADVYSLGAVLYAALTGRAPFSADNPVETLR